MGAEAAHEDVHDQVLSEAFISPQKVHPGRKKKKAQPQNKWKTHPQEQEDANALAQDQVLLKASISPEKASLTAFLISVC